MYLTYKLPGESTLIGIECKTKSIVRISSFAQFSLGIICFEEFVEGIEVARLRCLCSFHEGKHQVQTVSH